MNINNAQVINTHRNFVNKPSNFSVSNFLDKSKLENAFEIAKFWNFVTPEIEP